MALVVGHGREDLELGLEVAVDAHDGRHVAAAVAVVRRGPDGDDRVLREVILEERTGEGVGRS